MRKYETTISERDIIRREFYNLMALRDQIHIINEVSNLNEKENYIGNKAEKIRFHSYIDSFDEMMYRGEYSILLIDDSMVFLQYEFDATENIIGHSLSYLPSFRNGKAVGDGDKKKGDEEEEKSSNEITEEDEGDIDFKKLHTRISNFVRIDYESEGKEEYYHSLVHMHTGTERNALRIPIEHYVLPSEFLFFILKYIYRLPDEELYGLDVEKTRSSLLTDNEKKRLKMVFCNCIYQET